MYLRDDKITVSMAKHHAQLDAMINKIVDGVNMSKKTRITQFHKFKEKLLAHILIEEGSIFGFTEMADKKIMDTVRKLLKEHAQIKLLVDQIEKDLEADNSSRLGDFLELIYAHQRMENTTFYPYLDNHLAPDQREQVLGNIAQML